ncbi:MAG TPA: pyridoxal-phosphate dependent enzyme, partial [Leifsonia sp.]|nr:pyridoxal-phosphate dependent enzyme [Leifsonia sp.]
MHRRPLQRFGKIRCPCRHAPSVRPGGVGGYGFCMVRPLWWKLEGVMSTPDWAAEATTGSISKGTMSAFAGIGNTPLVELTRLAPRNRARVVAKLEWANPTGSMKDRMARSAVEGAMRDGRLTPGDTVVEYTAVVEAPGARHPLHAPQRVNVCKPFECAVGLEARRTLQETRQSVRPQSQGCSMT